MESCDLSSSSIDSTISSILCEELFSFCQNNAVVKNDADNISDQKFINDFIQACHAKKIELIMILMEIDSELILQKYNNYDNGNFNFNLFLEICKNFHINHQQKGLDDVNILFVKCFINNLEFQFNFIKFCIENKKVSELFNASSNEDLKIEISGWEKFQDDSLELFEWRFKVLFQILLNLYNDCRISSKVEELFIDALQKHPEIIILGLIECNFNFESKNIRSIVKNFIIKILYPVSNTIATSFLIQKLWKDMDKEKDKKSPASNTLLLESMVELYKNAVNDDQTNKLLRILEITQDLKALEYLLNDSYYIFVIDLACVASRREYLKLDKWINNKISKIKKPFIEACKYYIQQRLDNESKQSVPCHVETLSVILSCLQNHFKNEEGFNCTGDMKDILKIYNRLDLNINNTNNNNANIQNNNNNNLTSESNGNNFYNKKQLFNVFSEEVQKKSDGYLKRILTQFKIDKSIFERILDFFEKMKKSSDKQDKDVFQCIIESLIKELDYLQQYPKNELTIMAELIGGILNRNLVENNLFSFILQKIYYIMNTSKKDSNLIHFTIRVLVRCQKRLQQFPALWERLKAEIQKKSSIPINSYQFVDQAIDLTELRQRINFLFNNLDSNNVDTMSNRFKNDFENPTFIDIFTDVFTCRAINETNHHELFFNFLEATYSPKIYESLIEKTYAKILEYLRKIDNDDQRKKLNSAGLWLGTITLGRNKPIVSSFLDLRSLIAEAYQKGLLLQVIPFVTRVLSACAQSKVFKPPNPWLMALLKQLFQIYFFPDSKLKIKFEIENLFRSLNLSFDDESFKKVLRTSPSGSSVPSPGYEYLNDAMIHNTAYDYLNTEQPNLASKFGTINKNDEAVVLDSHNFYDLLKILLNSIKIILPLDFPDNRFEIHDKIRQKIVDCVEDYITTGEYLKSRYEKVLSSVEVLIKKDFARESNAMIIRDATTRLTSYLIFGTVLVDAKEVLPSILKKGLYSLFFQPNERNQPQQQQIDIYDETINDIVETNIDCCVEFIQKVFIKKAIDEMLERFNLKVDYTKKLGYERYMRELNFYNSFNISFLVRSPSQENSNNSEYRLYLRSISDMFMVLPVNVDLSVKETFKAWFDIFYTGSPDAMNFFYRRNLNSNVHFQTLDSIYSFFKMSFEVCYARCQHIFKCSKTFYQKHVECCVVMDAFVYLFILFLKDLTLDKKFSLLTRLFRSIAYHAQMEQKYLAQFNPLCYFRVLVMFYLEFISDSTIFQSNDNGCIKSNLTFVFYEFLKAMCPLKLPAFTYFWLEFISHRCFIGNSIAYRNSVDYWDQYYSLLQDLLEFEKPLYSQQRSEAFKSLHKGTLKLFLLLLHDFPDFLVNYSFKICEYLPHHCFAIRNTVLSASPKAIILPNPYIATEVDFSKSFPFHYTPDSTYQICIENYLKTQELECLKDLDRFLNSSPEFHDKIEFMNKVLYPITDNINIYKGNLETFSQLSINVIEYILQFCDSEGCYYLFGAMVNHLRFPSLDTLCFINFLMYFFKASTYREVVIRVVLERVFINQPHPWGLLYFLRKLSFEPNVKQILENIYENSKYVRSIMI